MKNSSSRSSPAGRAPASGRTAPLVHRAGKILLLHRQLQNAGRAATIRRRTAK